MDSPVRERSGISFEYKPAADGLTVTVERGESTLNTLLQWTFGSGAQAYTPVGIRDGVFFEHRVSYYTAAARPGRTLGHPGEASKSLEQALGQPQDEKTIARCFGCHATGVGRRLNAAEIIPGVECERCHGPGLAHAEASAKSRPEAPGLIRANRNLSATGSIAVCGECHRMPEKFSPTPERDDPLSIRFQPIGLMASQCFLKGQRLTCVTCHNPHENAQHNPEFYVSKCMACHQQSTPKPQCGLATRQNCLTCHMPKNSPAEFLTFTDHRIRVQK